MIIFGYQSSHFKQKQNNPTYLRLEKLAIISFIVTLARAIGLFVDIFIPGLLVIELIFSIGASIAGVSILLFYIYRLQQTFKESVYAVNKRTLLILVSLTIIAGFLLGFGILMFRIAPIAKNSIIPWGATIIAWLIFVFNYITVAVLFGSKLFKLMMKQHLNEQIHVAIASSKPHNHLQMSVSVHSTTGGGDRRSRDHSVTNRGAVSLQTQTETEKDSSTNQTSRSTKIANVNDTNFVSTVTLQRDKSPSGSPLPPVPIMSISGTFGNASLNSTNTNISDNEQGIGYDSEIEKNMEKMEHERRRQSSVSLKLGAINNSIRESIKAVKANINQIQEIANVTTSEEEIQMSKRAQTLLTNITKQTTLVFVLSSQAFPLLLMIILTSLNQNNQIMYMIFYGMICVIMSTLQICLWLSFVFADKYYNLCCAQCHICCESCFTTLARVAAFRGTQKDGD